MNSLRMKRSNKLPKLPFRGQVPVSTRTLINRRYLSKTNQPADSTSCRNDQSTNLMVEGNQIKELSSSTGKLEQIPLSDSKNHIFISTEESVRVESLPQRTSLRESHIMFPIKAYPKKMTNHKRIYLSERILPITKRVKLVPVHSEPNKIESLDSQKMAEELIEEILKQKSTEEPILRGKLNIRDLKTALERVKHKIVLKIYNQGFYSYADCLSMVEREIKAVEGKIKNPAESFKKFTFQPGVEEQFPGCFRVNFNEKQPLSCPERQREIALKSKENRKERRFKVENSEITEEESSRKSTIKKVKDKKLKNKLENKFKEVLKEADIVLKRSEKGKKIRVDKSKLTESLEKPVLEEKLNYISDEDEFNEEKLKNQQILRKKEENSKRIKHFITSERADLTQENSKITTRKETEKQGDSKKQTSSRMNLDLDNLDLISFKEKLAKNSKKETESNKETVNTVQNTAEQEEKDKAMEARRQAQILKLKTLTSKISKNTSSKSIPREDNPSRQQSISNETKSIISEESSGKEENSAKNPFTLNVKSYKNKSSKKQAKVTIKEATGENNKSLKKQGHTKKTSLSSSPMRKRKSSLAVKKADLTDRQSKKKVTLQSPVKAKTDSKTAEKKKTAKKSKKSVKKSKKSTKMNKKQSEAAENTDNQVSKHLKSSSNSLNLSSNSVNDNVSIIEVDSSQESSHNLDQLNEEVLKTPKNAFLGLRRASLSSKTVSLHDEFIQKMQEKKGHSKRRGGEIIMRKPKKRILTDINGGTATKEVIMQMSDASSDSESQLENKEETVQTPKKDTTVHFSGKSSFSKVSRIPKKRTEKLKLLDNFSESLDKTSSDRFKGEHKGSVELTKQIKKHLKKNYKTAALQGETAKKRKIKEEQQEMTQVVSN